MLTFKEFLTETAAFEKVHHNIGISHLKALTKNDPEGQVRYSIDHAGKLHAGSANKFIHNDLHSMNHGGDGNHRNAIKGYIEHKEDKFTHHVAYRTDEHGKNDRVDVHMKSKIHNHPILDKMAAHGIQRTHKPLDFEY